MSTLFGTSQLEHFKASLDARSQASVASAIERITEIKKRGGKVMVVTGSGPNIHEGVTTLIAELIRLQKFSNITKVVINDINPYLTTY